jgi:putative zinc ribbon protein
MDITDFCQSCSMPMDGPELWGTEEDGSPNRDYCKYCYQNGSFRNPGITMNKMRSHIIDFMEKEKIPADIIEAAVSRLPFLKRWKTSVII